MGARLKIANSIFRQESEQNITDSIHLRNPKIIKIKMIQNQCNEWGEPTVGSKLYAIDFKMLTLVSTGYCRIIAADIIENTRHCLQGESASKYTVM